MKNEKEEPELWITRQIGRKYAPIEGFYTNPSIKAEVLFHVRARNLHNNKKCVCTETDRTLRNIVCTYGLMMELNWLNSKQIEEEFATWYKL